MSCGVVCRHGLDPTLLCLWLAAVTPIRPLAWELPSATGTPPPQKKKVQNRTSKVQEKGDEKNAGFSLPLSIGFGPRLEATRLSSEKGVGEEVWTWSSEATSSITARLSLPRSQVNISLSGLKWWLLKSKHSNLLPSKNTDP